MENYMTHSEISSNLFQHNMCAHLTTAPTTPISDPLHRPFCGPYAPGRWELLVWQQLNPSAPGIEKCSWKLRVPQFQEKDVCCMHPKQNKTNTTIWKIGRKTATVGGEKISGLFVDSLWKLALLINMSLAWAPSFWNCKACNRNQTASQDKLSSSTEPAWNCDWLKTHKSSFQKSRKQTKVYGEQKYDLSQTFRFPTGQQQTVCWKEGNMYILCRITCNYPDRHFSHPINVSAELGLSIVWPKKGGAFLREKKHVGWNSTSNPPLLLMHLQAATLKKEEKRKWWYHILLLAESL